MIKSPTNIGREAVSSTGYQPSAVFIRYGWKEDGLVSTGLFLLVLVMRIPFLPRILYHWDSINFSLSLRHFDVANGQPHAPGYILYVFLGQFINRLLHDEHRTLLWISMASSGLAVVFLYFLGRDMFNRRAGVLAALFLATAPLFWFYGDIALPHSLDMMIVIGLVWILFHLVQGNESLAIPAAVGLGLAGGFRPQTQLFLMPLALLAGIKIGWRKSLVALFFLIAVDAAWLLPLFALNGGAARYLYILRKYSEAFNVYTSIFDAGVVGLIRNLRKIVLYTSYGLGFTLLPGALAGIKFLSFGVNQLKTNRRISSSTIASWIRSYLKDIRVWVILLWLAPALAYYSLIHMGQQGLVFVYLPALLLFVAAIEKAWRMRGEAIQSFFLVGLLLANCAVFLFAPAFPAGENGLKLLTLDTLRQHDRTYLTLFEGIRQNFSMESTIIFAANWRFVQYYLPDYKLVPYDLASPYDEGVAVAALADEAEVQALKWGIVLDQQGDFVIDAGKIGLKTGQGSKYTVIIFDKELTTINLSNQRQAWLNLPDGNKIAYMQFNPNEEVFIGDHTFEIIPKAPGGS